MEAIADNAQPQSPGRALATERERQGLGPADIAQRLHMSVSQVEALEADDYSRLPRGPFLRGFVRNYAKALGMPADDLLARLAQGRPTDPVPRIVVPSQNIRFDPLADRMSSPYVKAAAIATVAVCLGFAVLYWGFFVRNAPPISAAKKPVAEKVAVAMPPAPKVQAIETPPPAPPVVAAPEPVKPVPAKAAVPAKAEPTPAVQRVAATDPGSRLRFRFKGPSWLEIKDAGGKVIFTGLNNAGTEAEVSGKAPFRVIVGNAPEVEMSFNDRAFDLTPFTREAVARATVE